jgi:hypothetical protein
VYNELFAKIYYYNLIILMYVCKHNLFLLNFDSNLLFFFMLFVSKYIYMYMISSIDVYFKDLSFNTYIKVNLQ